MKQNQVELQRKTGESTIIVGDFDTLSQKRTQQAEHQWGHS